MRIYIIFWGHYRVKVSKNFFHEQKVIEKVVVHKKQIFLWIVLQVGTFCQDSVWSIIIIFRTTRGQSRHLSRHYNPIHSWSYSYEVVVESNTLAQRYVWVHALPVKHLALDYLIAHFVDEKQTFFLFCMLLVPNTYTISNYWPMTTT